MLVGREPDAELKSEAQNNSSRLRGGRLQNTQPDCSICCGSEKSAVHDLQRKVLHTSDEEPG